MAISVRSYDAINEPDDERILLEPRVLAAPFQVSEKTLMVMNSSVENMKKGSVSETIDLSDFEG